MIWCIDRVLSGSHANALRTVLSLFIAVSAVLLWPADTRAQNLLTNGDFSSGDLSGWSVVLGEDGGTPVGVDQTRITYDGSEGNPAGSALLDRITSTAFDNKDLIYQVLEVEVGKQYQVDADWMGDLLNGGTGRNWAETLVSFVDEANVPTQGDDFIDGWIQYKRATDGDPNTPAGGVFDWESILDVPDGGPADGIFTATENRMVFAFNLGGRVQSNNDTQPGFYWVDNASVTLIPEPTAAVLLLLGGLAIVAGRRKR